MTQVVEVEIPDFGTSVLGSLNQQRLCGQYCDVSILVQGQAFEAHRAVLAASSLYFRDLFSSAASSSSLSVFELPSSVTPACFRQILTFCYTGRLSMTPSQQLLLMYTAGYLQIQSVVERGMELMMKSSSSPLCCDSQTPSAGDDVQQQQHHRGLTPEELLLVCSRIKQERPETPVEDREERGAAGGLPATRGSALCYMGPGGTAGASSADVVPSGLQSYLQATGERSSPGGSSLPATDSPTSHPTEEELEEDFYSSSTHGVYGQIYGHATNPYLQEKMELLSLPLASERRPCVLIGRDTMALPASLISQIGYRCHPTLYTEGDPGEKVELVGGSGVYMTRGQLMNCHLCAGIKHKVLLRRLLATFFDRNTLANSCGTGIRSSTNDPSRKPLDNRVLNTVKLYCQNFAPNFKESEMNVIAADMCTNARRVRKRWLPKIQSLLPEGHPTPHPAPHQRKNKKRDPQSQQSSNSPFDLELRHLSTTYLRLDPHQEHSDKEGERGKEGEREKERGREGEREKERGREGERGRGVLHFGSSSETDGEKEVVQPEDSIPSSHRSSLPSSLSSLSPQEKEGPGDPFPSGSGLAETEEMGEELQEESQ